MPIEAKRVLVPLKGESVDQQTFRLACRLAKTWKGKLYVLYVIEVKRDLPLDADMSEDAAKGESVLQQIEKIGAEERCEVEAEILQAREVGPAVVQEAVGREVNLIVVGMPYKRRYGAFTMGHTIPYILKNAPCPVLVWREEHPGGGAQGR